MRYIKKNGKWIMIGIALVVSLILRIQNLWFPLGGDMHASRQTQIAITIQNYFRDGWTLLRYEMPVFGQPWRVPMEFPIYQSVVYFVMKILHKTNIDVWCRLVSLCVFYLSVFALKKVADLIVDRKTAYVICMVYLFAPFSILWSRAAMIDYMSVLFALIYVWGLYSWLSQGKRTFVVTLLFGCLAYLQKATSMFAYVFFLAFLIIGYLYKEILDRYQKVTMRTFWEYCKDNKVRVLILALLCILPVVPGACWVKYSDAVKDQSVFAHEWSSDVLRPWNYGTWEQKLTLSNWGGNLSRLMQYMGGKVMTACLTVAYLLFGKKRNMSIIGMSIITVFLTIFTLFNLYDYHDYYLIALTPFLSIIYASALCAITSRLSSVKKIGKVGVCAVIMMIMCAQIHVNYEYLENAMMRTERGEYASDSISCGMYIASITEQDERIVTEGEYAIPITFYYADRKGMMTTGVCINEWFFTDFLRQENYTTLVAHRAHFVDELAKYYDIIIQYPGLRDRYIYKFYQRFPPDQDNLIKIKYSNVEETLAVDAEFINAEGTSFHDTINLLVNTDEIYYNIEDSYYRADDAWKDIQSVHIDTPEGVEISVEY